MSKRLPTTERPRKLRSYALEQRDFSAGIWNDIPAVSVPTRGLSDGENIVIDELGHIRGRPGTHYLTEPMPGDPLALAYIPKTGDGKAYFIAKVDNKLYSSTHDSESPAYFLVWNEIKGHHGYCTGGSFSGSGLNDFHVRGKHTGTEGHYYIVRIDGTGSPNTFRWSNDYGSTWVQTGVPITGSKQDLEYGIKILFDSQTGHTLNDQWAFYAYPPLSANLAWGERSSFSAYGDKLLLHDIEGLYEVYYETERASLVWIEINCGSVFSYSNVWSSNADGAGHYFRRYTYTCARVVDGIITHESEPWHFFWGMAGGPLNRATFNTFRNSVPFGQTYITIGGLPDLLRIGNRFWTHLVIYSTMNITYENDNEFGGIVTNGADDEVFIYNTMIELENGDQNDTEIRDQSNDSLLRMNLEAGNILKSRFLDPIPNGKVGGMARDFLFSYHEQSGKVYYCSSSSPHPKHLGYCHQDQWVKGEAAVNAIKGSGTKAVFLGDRMTSTINVSTYDFGGESLSPVPVLALPVVVSNAIGVPKGNTGTVAVIDTEAFVALTNEGLRIFDGFKWSGDLSDKKFNRQIRNIPEGAVGVYGNGKYYLWYRSGTAQNDYNDRCLVLNVLEKHLPWSKITGVSTSTGGNSFPMPSLYCGAVAIEYQGQSLVCGYRRHYGTTYADRRIYWINTFGSIANAIFVKETQDQYHESYFKQADFPCSWTTRDWTGETEQHKLTCRNLYAYWSLDPDFEYFPQGFEADLNFIQDDEEKEPLKKIKTQFTEVKEISPSWQNECKRLRLKFSTNKTGFLFRGYTMDVDERKEPASGEGGNIHEWIMNQRNLASNLQLAGSTWKRTDLLEDIPYYFIGGKFQERWSGGSFSFLSAGEDGRFSFEDGPDKEVNSAISVVRWAGSGRIGFQAGFADAFAFSPDFSVIIWAQTWSGYLSDLIVFSPTSALTQFFKLQLSDSQFKISDHAGSYKTYSGFFPFWKHLAVIRKGSVWLAYIDGVLTAPASESGTITPSANCKTVTIANPLETSMSVFEPRHYAKALTAEDLAYHFHDVSKNRGRSTLPLR